MYWDFDMVYFNRRFKYYLKDKQECFIRYKTRGAAEHFISDKVRIASILNGFKNNVIYTHLVSFYERIFNIDVV